MDIADSLLYYIPLARSMSKCNYQKKTRAMMRCLLDVVLKNISINLSIFRLSSGANVDCLASRKRSLLIVCLYHGTSYITLQQNEGPTVLFDYIADRS